MGSQRGATTAILGGGVTGLAAAMTSGLPVFEASLGPGGICASYYVRPGSSERLPRPSEDDEAYRFEVGGGHWIFGGDPDVLARLTQLAPMRSYVRSSAVHLREPEMLVPYPLQDHLDALPVAIGARAIKEMLATDSGAQASPTMAGWLEATFGPTLGQLFFLPFHERYTAGLVHEIAPQDPDKSPIDRRALTHGAAERTRAVGYNPTYLYPVEGLDSLIRAMAAGTDVHHGMRLVRIDGARGQLEFANGATVPYERVLSTLPLDQVLAMAGLSVGPVDPSTAVVVINIGAERGARCPEEHWVYEPHSTSGFHRVGIYSNVDASFLPAAARHAGDRVAIYVEHSRRRSAIPGPDEQHDLAAATVAELQAMGTIGETEVVDPTVVPVAYTWSSPGSPWRARALAALADIGVDQIGRYGRWRFQGIADSVRDGWAAGSEARTR